MGNGIAHSFALNKHNVVLVDLNQEALIKAKKNIQKNLDKQVTKQVITPLEAQGAMAQLKFASTASLELKSCDLVIEAITEDFKIKAKILCEIEKKTPKHAIITSNTSSISITKIASKLQRPENFLGMHFMNPVPLMKLVEVIKGIQTSETTIKKITNKINQIQKTPILVNDYPGFVANRILMPMINEAIYTLYQGTATVNAIDEIMQLGMAHPMGPLKLADFIGLDICLAILKVMQKGFGNQKYAPCPLLENLVNAKMLGKKTGKGFYDWSTNIKKPTINKYFDK
jgi:3-hydroxybutyryl-CoA dehydrogenase